MDDVALLSSSREEAQRALNAASSWADSILREPMVSLRVHGQPLPEVDSYRYLGGVLHWAGSHGPLLGDLQSRLRSKTGQFLHWARAKQVPISLLCQLWAVYVEPIAKFLLPTIALSRSELQKVDLIQRKLARMILGLAKRSPIPSVLLTGWVSWSATLPVWRLSLLFRIMSGSPCLLTFLYEHAGCVPGTWSNQAHLDLLSITGRAELPPQDKRQRREITLACIIVQLRQWLWPYRKVSARQ